MTHIKSSLVAALIYSLLLCLLPTNYTHAQLLPNCDDFIASASVTPSALGACTGTITLTLSGGTAPYTVQGDSSIPSTTFLTDVFTINNVCAGTYSSLITDSNGCIAAFTAIVTNDGSGDCATLTATYNATPASCNAFGAPCNGTVQVFPSGGTAPYSTTIDGVSFAGTAENLCAGTHIVIVADAMGCAYTLLAVVDNLSIDMVLNTTPNTSETTSPLDCNGSIIPTVSGGIPPYIYTISPSGGSPANPLNGLCAGTYCVTVADASGCSTQACATVENSFSSGCDDFIASASVTPSALGACTGTITLTLSGGTAPYTVQGDSSIPSTTFLTDVFTINNVCAGTHVLLITDSNGCIAAFTAIVTNDGGGDCATLTATYNATPASCNAFGAPCNGTVQIFPSGGTAPYFTTIDGVSFVGTADNLCAGTHIVIVVDAMGCAYTLLAVVDNLSIDMVLNTTPNTSETTSPLDCNGSIIPTVSGGIPPYTYTISSSGGSPANPLNGLCAGTYCVTVADASGCSTQACIAVINDFPTATIVAQSDTIYAEIGTLVTVAPLNNDSGTGALNILSATVPPPHELSIDFENDLISIVANTSGGSSSPIVISYVALDEAGQVATGTIIIYLLPDGSCDAGCVYPGDADNNGVADNFDVLQIGLGYDYTGAAREDQSIVWYPHPSADWGLAAPSGTDFKYADCNGNGTINAADTAAVALNYGWLHGKGDAESVSGIPLFFEPALTSVPDGNDTLYLSIHLGNSATPADEFYGIAFSVNYDATLATFQNAEIAEGSWAGDESNSLLFAKNLASNSRGDLCFTRTDHNNTSGAGAIVRTKFVIIENIDGGKGTSEVSAPFSFENIRCIKHDGTIIEIAPEEIVITSATNAPNSQLPEINVFPNPVSGWLFASLPVSSAADVRIFDAAGRSIYTAQGQSGMLSISTATWQKGVYFVQTTTQEGSTVHKIIVTE